MLAKSAVADAGADEGVVGAFADALGGPGALAVAQFGGIGTGLGDRRRQRRAGSRDPRRAGVLGEEEREGSHEDGRKPRHGSKDHAPPTGPRRPARKFVRRGRGRFANL